MTNKIYCSTGVFIGRVNNRDYKLFLKNHREINCDGFEFMIFPGWYDILDDITDGIVAERINVPVVHSDKKIGDMLSDSKENGMDECIRTWKLNCYAAAKIGAEKIVAHMWGIPNSDRDIDVIIENVGKLKRIAEDHGLIFLGENCCCVNQSPLVHFPEILNKYSDFSFIIDTRTAQFHNELEKITSLDELWHGAVKHIHISDFHGTFGDFASLYPILAPGKGDIDWNMFFESLKRNNYTNSITLESPTMRPDHVDANEINQNLDFIRKNIR